MARREGAEPVKMPRFGFNGVCRILREDGLLQRKIEARAVGEFHSESVSSTYKKIAGNRCFVESDEIVPGRRRLFHPGGDSVDRRICIEPDWRDLGQPNGDEFGGTNGHRLQSRLWTDLRQFGSNIRQPREIKIKRLADRSIDGEHFSRE